MSELYKLPLGGDYVDPMVVTRICYLAQEPSNAAPNDIRIPPRVVVWTGDNCTHLIRCNDDAHAMRLRDEIGEAINLHRRTADKVD